MTSATMKALLLSATMAVGLGATDASAGVRGRALLTDGPSRVKPGNLILCTINGDERKMEKLVEGPVIDARFSPDGKQVVYGMSGKIMILDLATRKSREIGQYTIDFTYFNWCQGDRICWSDGPEAREIFSVDLEGKDRKSVYKGNAGRTTMSLDGKRLAWVMPPVCAAIGGKTYGIMGGCGGSVSPSGRYLTSNLTTTHNLMGIFTFDENGPSPKPITTVVALGDHAINGFHFGRTDDWVCYTVEEPANISPIAFIAYWRTDDHIEIAKKHCIKDYFDETDVLPAGAELEKITVCAEGPTNAALVHEVTNAGAVRPLKVVGHYRTKDGACTPQLRDGVTWKADAGKLALTVTEFKGLAETGRITATAEYKGKTASFDVSVLPALTGDGFKGEYFSDYAYANKVLERVDRYIDFRWENGRAPDPAINKGRTPYAVQWTGMINVQTDGDYVFSFLQGEGNDRWVKTADGAKSAGWGVWVDDKVAVTLTKEWNYPWSKPKAGAPVALKKGLHAIKVRSVGDPGQPVICQLYWSGPGIKQSLLGGGYIHSNGGAAAAGK
jgi:hypothetical protein